MFTRFIHYHFRDNDAARNSMLILAGAVGVLGTAVVLVRTFLL